MKKQSIVMALLVTSSFALPAIADGSGNDLDISLTVLEAGEGAEQAIRNIELPEQASDTARENAAFGLETANTARQKGQAKSAEARENAAGLASEAASQARERVNNDIARGVLENVPGDVRENITAPGQDARDAANNARNGTRGN